MASNYAIKKVAAAWCTEETKNVPMSPALAIAFANILDDEIRKCGTWTREEMFEGLQRYADIIKKRRK